MEKGLANVSCDTQFSKGDCTTFHHILQTETTMHDRVEINETSYELELDVLI